MACKDFCRFRYNGRTLRYRYFYTDKRYYKCCRQFLRCGQCTLYKSVRKRLFYYNCYLRYYTYRICGTCFDRWIKKNIKCCAGGSSFYGNCICFGGSYYTWIKHYKDTCRIGGDSGGSIRTQSLWWRYVRSYDCCYAKGNCKRYFLK